MSEAARNLVVIDVDDLERRIEGAVRRALAARPVESADWLDTKGVAALIGRHPRTVTRLVRDEALPCSMLGPKSPRYDRAAVLEWMRARRKG